MDPVSAIGLASSVICFIDFSWALITGAKKRSETGGAEEASSLEDLEDELEVILESLGKEYRGKSKAERAIVRLAGKCKDEARLLIELLSGLVLPDNHRSLGTSLQVQLRLVLGKKKEIEALQEKLRDYRTKIMLNLQILLQTDQSTLSRELNDFRKESYDNDTRTLSGIDKLREDLLDAIGTLVPATTSSRTFVRSEDKDEVNFLHTVANQLENYHTSMMNISQQHRILRSLKYLDMSSRQLQIQGSTTGTCGWILGLPSTASEANSKQDLVIDPSLQPDASKQASDIDSGISKVSLENRPEAALNISHEESNGGFHAGTVEHHKTKQTVADTAVNEDLKVTPNEGTRNVLMHEYTNQRISAKHNLVTWLREGDGLFHITGKAGSGKSTLIKFIAQHELVKEHLKFWSGQSKLITAAFYFWRTGSVEQKSLHGLYRTLLFQIFSQYPELIDGVSHLADVIQELQLNSVEEAFTTVVKNGCRNHYKFCFFIDGLDECIGNRLEHETLAAKVKSWTRIGSIKICTSSRQYAEFLKILACPEEEMVHLHLLNRQPIYEYCYQRFCNDREGKLMEEDERHMLAQDIGNNAQGVFLWARLVMEQLLLALRNGHSRHTLKKVLNEIPRELDDYYEKMLVSVDNSKVDAQMMNRMLLLALRAPSNFQRSAISFSWIDELGSTFEGLQDPKFPMSQPGAYTIDEISQRVEIVSKRVDGLTRGFLELNSRFDTDTYAHATLRAEFLSPEVTFTHRTASDYLLQNEARMAALKVSWPDFESSYPYSKISLAQLHFGLRPDISWDKIHEFVWKSAGLSEISSVIPVLPQLKALCQSIPIKSYFYTTNIERFILCRSGDSAGLFVHFAASMGYHGFVMAEVSANPSLRSVIDGCHLLIAATIDYHIDRDENPEPLALSLLNHGVELGELCSLEDMEGRKTLWPVWIITTLQIITSLLKQRTQYSAYRVSYDKRVQMLKLLRDYAIQVNQDYLLTFILKEDDPALVVQGARFRELQVSEARFLALVSFYEEISADDITDVPYTSDHEKSPIGSATTGQLLDWLDWSRKEALDKHKQLKASINEVKWQNSTMDFSKTWVRLY